MCKAKAKKQNNEEKFHTKDKQTTNISNKGILDN